MKDNKPKKKTRNLHAVVIGTISGLIAAVFLFEFIQLLAAYFVGSFNLGMAFGPVTFYAEYTLPQDISVFFASFVHASAMLVCIITTDLITRILAKTKPGLFRYSLIFVFLINTGYLMIKMFYFTLLFILNDKLNTDWNNLMALYDLSGLLKVMLTVVVLVMMVSFVGVATGKIKKYINAQ